MKTKFFTLLTAALLLSACGPTPTTTSGQPTSPPKDVFTSIKDAVTKQLLLKCEYQDGDQTTTTYIKGNMVRFFGTGQEVNVSGLMRDNKFYLWDTAQKKGMTIDMSQMQGAKMGETPIKSIDDVVSVLESKKEKCFVSPESSSMFDIPSDVTFSNALDFFGSAKP